MRWVRWSGIVALDLHSRVSQAQLFNSLHRCRGLKHKQAEEERLWEETVEEQASFSCPGLLYKTNEWVLLCPPRLIGNRAKLYSIYFEAWLPERKGHMSDPLGGRKFSLPAAVIRHTHRSLCFLFYKKKPFTTSIERTIGNVTKASKKVIQIPPSVTEAPQRSRLLTGIFDVHAFGFLSHWPMWLGGLHEAGRGLWIKTSSIIELRGTGMQHNKRFCTYSLWDTIC